MNKLSGRQSGVGHLGLIIGIVVVLALGGTGWWVWQQNQKDSPKNSAEKALEDAVKNAKCNYDDKNLCKFMTSWKANDDYTVSSTQKVNSQSVTTVIKSDGDNKSHIKVTGGEAPYEMVNIDNATYTLAGNGTWYKQTTSDSPTSSYEPDINVDFNEPEAEGGTTSYKKVGKEKCGNFTCFKYEVTDTTTPNTKQYLWFDDDDYLLRRMQVTSPDNTYEATFSYENVTIKEPSPVKNLGSNQYIVPGADEPVSLPNTGDMYQ